MSVVKQTYFQRISNSLKKTWMTREAILQVAALCYRPTDDGHEILLITSRGRGHWILPKGWPKNKKSSADTALLEAFEEAGIQGTVSETPIGEYHYDKTSKGGLMLNCVAMVYEVAFVKMVKDFPEKGEREVKWFTPEAAAEAVSSPELATLLRNFTPSL